jgi:hypothetical protein
MDLLLMLRALVGAGAPRSRARRPRPSPWSLARRAYCPLLERLEDRLPPGNLLATSTLSVTSLFGFDTAATGLPPTATSPTTTGTTSTTGATGTSAGVTTPLTTQTAPTTTTSTGSTPAATTSTSTSFQAPVFNPLGGTTAQTVSVAMSLPAGQGSGTGGSAGAAGTGAGGTSTAGSGTSTVQKPPTGGGTTAGSNLSALPPQYSPNSVIITGIAPDTGSSASDALTNTGTLSAKGTGSAGTKFNLSVDGQLNATGQVGTDGTWTVSLSGALAQGTHTLSVAPAQGGSGNSFTVRVDTTAPTVTLTAPDFTNNNPLPRVLAQVTSSDSYGYDTRVHIDVDLRHDGSFDDPGDRDYAVIQANMPAMLSRPLPEGVFQLRARAYDLAGNEADSAAVTMQVDPNAGYFGSDPLYRLYTGYARVTQAPGEGWLMFGKGGQAPPSWLNGWMPEGPRPGTNANPVQTFLDIARAHRLEIDVQDRVLVNVRYTLPKYADDVQTSLQQLGMAVTGVTPSQNMITGWLPILRLDDLVRMPHYDAVTPVLRPVLHTGSVESEGDPVILGPQYRAETGAGGQGVKVGILSDSAGQTGGGLADSISTGDLNPADSILVDGSAGDTDEGRAMMEIVQDVAPQSVIDFATGDGGPQMFANDISLLAGTGHQVIADDLVYVDQPFYNDGVVAQAVDAAVANQGVTYLSSAGNFDSTGYEAAWAGFSTTVTSIGTGTFQDFGGGTALQQFTLATGDTIDIVLQWDSAFLEGGSPQPNFQVGNELDFFVTDSSGNTLETSSTNNTLSTDEAFQEVTFTNNDANNTSFALAIELTQGSAPTRVRWISFEADPLADHEGAPTSFGHEVARGTLAIGAVDFTTPTVPESFTALGAGVPILFDAQGNRLAVPEIRNKPDFAAPDGVSTTLADFNPFFGTSAAVPHAAGAVADLLSQVPGLDRATVVQHLQQTAVDLGSPGFTGAGLIQLAPLTVHFAGDSFESNDTSDKATNFGILAKGGTFDLESLTIAKHADGLPDYDWYRWTAAEAGTVSVKETVTRGGDLELHLFTLAGNTLVELGSSTAAGLHTRTLGAVVSAGQVILVEVKGRNSAPGVMDQGSYALDVELT